MDKTKAVQRSLRMWYWAGRSVTYKGVEMSLPELVRVLGGEQNGTV